MLIINLKTYSEGTGSGAVRLSDAALKASKQTGVEIVMAAQPTDIRILSSLGIAVFSQHVDPVGYGSNTGHITPHAVKEAGAIGTLINHAERKIPLLEIKRTIDICKQEGLRTIVCVDNLEDSREIASWGPDYMAFEDPELIGTLKSISRMKPDSVRQFVDSLKGTGVTPLCGAGIATGDDIKAARDLGSQGGILATAVVKSQNPEGIMMELAGPIRK